MMYFFAAPVLVALGNQILIYFSREIMIRFLEEQLHSDKDSQTLFLTEEKHS